MKRFRSSVAKLVTVGILAGIVPVIATHPAFAARSKTITIADASIVEGDAGASTLQFTVKWTGAKGGAAPSVTYATADGTATAGSDYATRWGSVNLTNGGCRCGTISVSILGDAISEGAETFVVNLSSPVNATIGDGQATGTIYDNEGPPSLVVTDVSADEAAGALGFSVLLTTAVGSAVTVDYATADGSATAGTDYAAAIGTLTFNSGQTSKVVSVPVTDDVLSEDDETVSLKLSNATVTLADGEGVGTIVNDDADPNVAVADAAVTEGDAGTAVATFTVTLSAASGQETSVDWSTADATATAGVDYQAASGTVTVAAGQLSGTFDVTVDGDLVREGDETFTATITNPVGLTIVTDTGTATIADDDPAPTVSAADLAVGESGGSATVTFSLSNPSTTDVSFDWSTADGSATAGSDYTTRSGRVTITAGSLSATADVPILPDTTDEPDETFSIALSGPVNGSVGTGATVTIVDDDAAVTSLSLKVVRTTKTVKAKGLLEPAASSLTVKVTLSKKQGAKYVRVATKTVTVKALKDRDGDGLLDGQYVAAFARPAKGGYRFTATFAGTPDLRKISKRATFTL